MAVSLIIKVCLGWYPRHDFESASRFFFRLWVQLLLSLVLRLMVRHLMKLGESRYIFYNAWWPIVFSVPVVLPFQHWFENSFRARLLAFVFASLSSWRTQRVIVLTSLYSILFYLHLKRILQIAHNLWYSVITGLTSIILRSFRRCTKCVNMYGEESNKKNI